MEESEPKYEKEPLEEKGSESLNTSDYSEREKLNQELRDSIKAMTIKVNFDDDSSVGSK